MVTAGTGVTVTGTGSNVDPFVVSSPATAVTAGDGIAVTGTGTGATPYIITAAPARVLATAPLGAAASGVFRVPFLAAIETVGMSMAAGPGILIPAVGTYGVSFQGNWTATASAAGERFTGIQINGVTPTPRVAETDQILAGFGIEQNGHEYMRLNAGDIVTLAFWQNSGLSVNVAGRLSVVRIA